MKICHPHIVSATFFGQLAKFQSVTEIFFAVRRTAAFRAIAGDGAAFYPFKWRIEPTARSFYLFENQYIYRSFLARIHRIASPRLNAESSTPISTIHWTPPPKKIASGDHTVENQMALRQSKHSYLRSHSVRCSDPILMKRSDGERHKTPPM